MENAANIANVETPETISENFKVKPRFLPLKYGSVTEILNVIEHIDAFFLRSIQHLMNEPQCQESMRW